MRRVVFEDCGLIGNEWVSRWHYADGTMGEHRVPAVVAAKFGDITMFRETEDRAALHAANAEAIIPGEENRYGVWAVRTREAINRRRAMPV